MKLILPIIITVLHQIFFVHCTDRPIVGILSQEFTYLDPEFYPATNYIAASYVKAVEAAGARVVPIFIKKTFSYYNTRNLRDEYQLHALQHVIFDENRSQLALGNLLYSINGVIIPGGVAPLKSGNGYYDAATVIYKLSKQMNDQGNFFPILGLCLGFEALLIMSNNNEDMQTSCDVIHENYPLIFSNNFRRSLMYAALPQELHTSLKYFDVTHNNHHWCTTKENFTKNSLDKEWLITATNINMRGLEFISSVEHKKYPFLALQFHPEKIFEWLPSQNNPHSRIGILANRYFYDLFVSLTKLSSNAFHKEKDERDALIYNHNPRMMKAGSFFDQIYVFT